MPPAGKNKFNIIARAAAIILQPDEAWEKIASENGDKVEVATGYMLILAALPALAGFLGKIFFGYWLLGGVYRAPTLIALISGVAGYAYSLLWVFIITFVTAFLAPRFGGRRNYAQAFRLVVYAETAVWVTGITGIFSPSPLLALILTLVSSFYAVYLIYLGLPLLLKVPKGKTLAYITVLVMITFSLSVFIGFALDAFAHNMAFTAVLPRHR